MNSQPVENPWHTALRMLDVIEKLDLENFTLRAILLAVDRTASRAKIDTLVRVGLPGTIQKLESKSSHDGANCVIELNLILGGKRRLSSF